jgi:hypothetical protein
MIFSGIVKHWTGKYFHVIVYGFKILNLLFELNLVSLVRMYKVKVLHKCFCGVEMFDSKTLAAMSRLNAVALFRRSVQTDFTEETLIEFSSFGTHILHGNFCKRI